jgi:hypothetical protein
MVATIMLLQYTENCASILRPGDKKLVYFWNSYRYERETTWKEQGNFIKFSLALLIVTYQTLVAFRSLWKEYGGEVQKVL